MLYIHIPFCQQRCIYCDFYSTTHSVDQSLAYVQAVANEMRHRRDQLPSTRLSSVYIGGGTPSLLPLQAIQLLFSAIRSNFTIDENAEITFEANPDDINSELLDTLISVGVNRISLGVQSFNDKQLQILHRRHSSTQAIKAVQLIHRKGIHHISIDLIYGQPHQTVETWSHDLRMALSLPIDHLSAYALSVEGKTPLQRLLQAQKLTLPTDDATLQMFQHLCETMRQGGFLHYEISNFSLPNCHSRHNSGYWQSRPYLGIGPGAHSYDGNARHFNPLNLQDYIAQCGLLQRQTEHLTIAEQCNDFVFTALRTSSGLDLTSVAERFGAPYASHIREWALPHIRNSLLTLSDNVLCLTEQGIFVSNDVISDLMHLEEDNE